MSPEEILDCVKKFVALIELGCDGDIEKQLELSLDKLALCSHFLGDIPHDNTSYPDSPKLDRYKTAALVETRFPNHGFYNVPCHIADHIADTEIMLGDAIDDIQDIYNDLKEVLWRWHNNSPADGLWQLNWGWRHHWGAHLRNLQWYLFMSRHEGSR